MYKNLTTQARLEGGLPCEMVSVIQLVDLAGSKSIHNEVSMPIYKVFV